MVGSTLLEIPRHKSNLDLRNSFPYRMQDTCPAKCSEEELVVLKSSLACFCRFCNLSQIVSIPIREENFSILDACSPLFKMQASQISATIYFLQILWNIGRQILLQADTIVFYARITKNQVLLFQILHSIYHTMMKFSILENSLLWPGHSYFQGTYLSSQLYVPMY